MSGKDERRRHLDGGAEARILRHTLGKLSADGGGFVPIDYDKAAKFLVDHALRDGDRRVANSLKVVLDTAKSLSDERDELERERDAGRPTITSYEVGDGGLLSTAIGALAEARTECACMRRVYEAAVAETAAEGAYYGTDIETHVEPRMRSVRLGRRAAVDSAESDIPPPGELTEQHVLAAERHAAELRRWWTNRNEMIKPAAADAAENGGG